jgi:hypothetical protein
MRPLWFPLLDLTACLEVLECIYVANELYPRASQSLRNKGMKAGKALPERCRGCFLHCASKAFSNKALFCTYFISPCTDHAIFSIHLAKA